MNCPNCGKPSEGNLSYCTECGARLDKINEYNEVKDEINDTADEIMHENAIDQHDHAEIHSPDPQQVQQSAGGYVNTAAAAAAAKKTGSKKAKRHMAPCRPLSTWSYVWRSILFALPIIGIVFLFIFAFSEGINENSRSFARSWLIFLLIAAILIIVAAVLWYFYAPQIVDWLKRFTESLQKLV